MNQKNYQLPKVGGGELTKTLATPTPKRMIAFLAFCGVDSFDALRNSNGQLDYAFAVMKTAEDPRKLVEAMDVCLVEGSADIDFSDVDLRLTDEVIQDFFEQRSKTLLARMQ